VIGGFAAWRLELMRTGRIPPDSDTTVDRDQAGLDCQRYVELVDMVRGDEGREVFDALLASMQVPEDYEVYESTVRVLHHFKTPDVGEWLHDAWDGLAQRSPEMAGNLLNLLARGSFGNEALTRFNQAWGAADSRHKANMLEKVLEEEANGWLDTPAARAKLRPLD
jgi:hypothetical protein